MFFYYLLKIQFVIGSTIFNESFLIIRVFEKNMFTE